MLSSESEALKVNARAPQKAEKATMEEGVRYMQQSWNIHTLERGKGCSCCAAKRNTAYCCAFCVITQKAGASRIRARGKKRSKV